MSSMNFTSNMQSNYKNILPDLGKKKGRRPNNARDPEDDKFLKGPLTPGDTYGIKMSGIISIADNIMK
jgi:hypothetical protein